jgi:hypothetical protein
MVETKSDDIIKINSLLRSHVPVGGLLAFNLHYLGTVIKRIYLIWCTRCVSGMPITYAQYRNIGKSDISKVFGNNKTKKPNRIAKIVQGHICLREEYHVCDNDYII